MPGSAGADMHGAPARPAAAPAWDQARLQAATEPAPQPPPLPPSQRQSPARQWLVASKKLRRGARARAVGGHEVSGRVRAAVAVQRKANSAPAAGSAFRAAGGGAPWSAGAFCGYGCADLRFGRGGGTCSPVPFFMTFKKYFCAWLRICGRAASEVRCPVQGKRCQRQISGARLNHGLGSHIRFDSLPVPVEPAAAGARCRRAAALPADAGRPAAPRARARSGGPTRQHAAAPHQRRSRSPVARAPGARTSSGPPGSARAPLPSTTRGIW